MKSGFYKYTSSQGAQYGYTDRRLIADAYYASLGGVDGEWTMRAITRAEVPALMLANDDGFVFGQDTTLTDFGVQLRHSADVIHHSGADYWQDVGTINGVDVVVRWDYGGNSDDGSDCNDDNFIWVQAM